MIEHNRWDTEHLRVPLALRHGTSKVRNVKNAAARFAAAVPQQQIQPKHMERAKDRALLLSFSKGSPFGELVARSPFDSFATCLRKFSTGVSLWRATIQRARLRLASDIRHGKCDVEELDCRRTLEYLDVNSGSVLLVCVVPTAKSLVTAPSPCMSHVQLGSEGYRDGQQRDCRPRGGDGKPAEVGGRAS